MNFLNTCILEGYLTKDSSQRASKNGAVVTEFRIAQNRSYVNSKGELIKEANFIDCEVWGEGFANKMSKYLVKGSAVRVIGRIKIDSWVDDETKYHERFTVVCDKLDLLPISSKDARERFNSGEAFNGDCDKVDAEDASETTVTEIKLEDLNITKGIKKKKAM